MGRNIKSSMVAPGKAMLSLIGDFSSVAVAQTEMATVTNIFVTEGAIHVTPSSPIRILSSTTEPTVALVNIL